MNLMSELVPSVDAGLQVGVVYIDFRKAFDTVDHEVLLLILSISYLGPLLFILMVYDLPKL